MSDSACGFRLRAESADAVPNRFVIADGEAVLGSGVDSDLLLTAPGVSRRHARLRRDGDRLEIEDLGSKNGTRVNGAKISVAVQLARDDRIEIGQAELVVEQVRVDDLELGLDFDLAAGDIGATAARRVEEIDTQLMTGTRQLSDISPSLVRVLLSELARGPRGVEPVAAVLRALLTAEGAAVIELAAGGDGEPVVLSTDGVHGELPAFDDLIADGGSEWRWARAVDDGLTFGVLDLFGQARGQGSPEPAGRQRSQQTDPEPAGHALAAIAWGDASSPEVAQALLEAALLWTAGQRSAAEVMAAEAAVPELVWPAGHLPGQSPAMQELYRQVGALLQGDVPVLILGETGVGKEHVAKLLHESSPRRRGPLVAINCAAIPHELLEAELFGVGKGVATGVRARRGKFADANGGILMLDEIGDMPLALQAKLLRVLQDGVLRPLGSEAVELDVRVIAATHADLDQRVADGAFRQDLYYRLAGFELQVPALRQRRQDIPPLIRHFAQRFCAETGKRVRGFTVAALQRLVDHPWPGNVRQLEHEVRRLVYLCDHGEAIDSTLVEHLEGPHASTLASAHGHPSEGEVRGLTPALEALERQLIESALDATGGNQSQAARRLEISRGGLILRMKRLGIHPADP